MCWGFETCLYAGAQVWFVGAWLIRRNSPGDKAHAFVMMSFATIRFLEAWLWFDLSFSSSSSNICSTTNSQLTSFWIPVLYVVKLGVSWRYSRVPLPNWWPVFLLVVTYALFWFYWGSCTMSSGTQLVLVSESIPAWFHFVLYYATFRPQSTIKSCLKWLLHPSVLAVIVLSAVFSLTGPILCTVSTLSSLQYLLSP